MNQYITLPLQSNARLWVGPRMHWDGRRNASVRPRDGAECHGTPTDSESGPMRLERAGLLTGAALSGLATGVLTAELFDGSILASEVTLVWTGTR